MALSVEWGKSTVVVLDSLVNHTKVQQMVESIAEVAEQLRSGELSATSLAETCLARIDELNAKLNAFITVTHELAREQAAVADREIRSGRWRGGLHGIPVAVKDFYDTAGIRTTAGFAHFARRVPTRNAAMVSRLFDAGAVLVGKTNMHRLGSGTTSLESDFGPVVNPWNADRVAGGSSGGSAVAVATGMCFGTVDTDAVGSGRLPAAICGVACFKPTYGVLDASGILGDQPPPDETIPLLSHPCVTARTPDEVAVMFRPLAGRALAKPGAARRLGVVTNYHATSEIRAAFERCVEALRGLPVEIVEVVAPFDAARFDAASIRRDRADESRDYFGAVDAFVLPTLTARAPTVEEARAQGELAVSPDNTFFGNYFGFPAINVPAGWLDDGHPFGVQLVGRRGADDLVLSLACASHRAIGAVSGR
jgi:aspartyl-tRNA(Asn)/glutamyl-tRNA(Gln) amidotransferase subunit A